jgi:hypothetical protein
MGLNGCKDDDGDDPQTAPVVPTSNFCYNFTNLAMPYDSIQGGTILTTTNNDGFYEVDLGFSFNLCEQSFSTLFIQSDFLTTTFTYEINSQGTDLRKYYILAHGDLDFEQKFDNNTFEIVSKIITTTTGSTGNKVTTIEFREFEYDDFQGSEEYTVNYKIIFSESDNSVSYHYGPNDLTVDFSQDVFNQFAIGLYSTNELDGLFLKGNPLSPTTVFNGFNSELTTWPLENTFYKFIKK